MRNEIVCKQKPHRRRSSSVLMHDAMAEFGRTTLLILGALFPIINPPENIPIFLTLTNGLSPENRSVLARKIAIN